MICDDWSQRDSRINAFHKLNGGVSSARNLGIEKAKGIWLTFIDSDDFISSDFMNRILEEAARANADLVFNDFNIIYQIRKHYSELIHGIQIKKSLSVIIWFIHGLGLHGVLLKRI